MSDMKYCPSCGTALSVSTVFCHNCGQKQKVEADVSPAATESIPVNEIPEQLDNGPEAIDAPAFELANNENPVQPEAAPELSPTLPEPVFDHPELKQGYQPVMPPPFDEKSVNPAAPAAYSQPKATQPQASPKPAPKKKFPWIFTALWIIMTVAVGIWTYMVLVSPDYDYPVLTEDAQRYILLTAAIALVIYTLSLKLTMKKLKALPTVILVVASLVVFYFFCTVELTDGDWLHDTVTSITQNIIPTSGD